MAKLCPHCGGTTACAIVPDLPFDRCPSYWFEMREIERRAYLTRLAKARTASAQVEPDKKARRLLSTIPLHVVEAYERARNHFAAKFMAEAEDSARDEIRKPRAGASER